MRIEDIANIGVIGAGGAGFPTHVKLASHPDTLIMNAAECEPLLHKDMEILHHYSDEVLDGFRTAMTITGAIHGIIGIKEKHTDLIRTLKQKLSGNIRLHTIGDFYPAGDEMILVYLTTGRVVQPGELPVSVGCLVQNVETLYNIARNVPVVEKFVSVAGAVESPATVKVPVGISYAEILSKFNIRTRRYKVRLDGLMMGRLEEDLNQVVTKRSGAIIVLPHDHHCVTMYQRFATAHDTDRIAKASCDQCSYCTEFCPRYLLGHPVRPEIAMRNRMFTREGNPFVDLGSDFCCECNLCTLYACPEGLDPKGATIIEKKILAEQNLKWEGLPVTVHPMAEYRKVPSKKLIQRLDVQRFKDEGPLLAMAFRPDRVRIPLSQHIGSPAKPVVKKGDPVKKFDLIGEAGTGISTNIHASIDGTIKEITGHEIVIQRN